MFDLSIFWCVDWWLCCYCMKDFVMDLKFFDIFVCLLIKGLLVFSEDKIELISK